MSYKYMNELKNLEEYFKKHNESLPIEKQRKPSSIKAYMSNMKTLCNKLNLPVLKTGVFDFNKLSNTKLLLNNDWFKNLGDNTKKNYMNGLIVCLDVVDKDLYSKPITILQEEVAKLKNEILKNYKSNKLNEKQKKDWISMKNIQDKLIPYCESSVKDILGKRFKHYRTENQIKLNSYLVSLLYSGKYIPIRRLELNSLKVITKKIYDNMTEKDDNYLIINVKKPFVSFNRYKTDKQYGETIVNIPDELASKIKLVLKSSANNQILFCNPVNISECIKQDKLGVLITETFKNCLDKHITLDTLRSIYTTESYDTNKSLEDREKLARQMGTSVNTQMICYNKYVEKEELCDLLSEE